MLGRREDHNLGYYFGIFMGKSHKLSEPQISHFCNKKDEMLSKDHKILFSSDKYSFRNSCHTMKPTLPLHMNIICTVNS